MVLGAGILSACGFHPLYGDAATEAGSQSALQGNLLILPIGGGESARFGQILKNALEDKFNPQGLVKEHPDYTLAIVLHRNLIPSVVRSDGTILRYDVRFETSFTLTKDAAHAPLPPDPKKPPTPEQAAAAARFMKENVITGTVRRISSYNVVPNANFATYQGEQNLNERMLKEIAEDYVLRISGYLVGK